MNRDKQKKDQKYPSEKQNHGRPRLMTHMVASYPSYDASLEVAKALIDGGAAYLEVQFPFSDPSADGPVIQTACDAALSAGFTLDEGFRLIQEISAYADSAASINAADAGKSIPAAESRPVLLFVMSYAAPAVRSGVKQFVRRLAENGAAGCIIPDLPAGCDEGLYQEAAQQGIHAVPVIAPNISSRRLEEILALQPAYIYAALRAGITGSETSLTPQLIEFLDLLRQRGVKVFGGFGIRSADQVRELSPHLHAAVVGSYLVSRISEIISKDTQSFTAGNLNQKENTVLYDYVLDAFQQLIEQ